MAVGVYSLFLIAISTGGSWRPVSLVVPDLSYQECSTQSQNIRNDDGLKVLSLHCALTVK